MTSLNRLIPCFGSLDQALALRACRRDLSGASVASRWAAQPHASARPARLRDVSGVAWGMLEASVVAGESGPVTVLADLTCAE